MDCRGAIRHADRLTASPFAVAAFAVCIRKKISTCLWAGSRKLPLFSDAHGSLLARRRQQGRAFICRLFQRAYCDERSPSANTIQWTFPPFCLALRSLSSSPLYWLYCDVRSDPAAFSDAFSRPAFSFIKYHPSETCLSSLSSTVWSVWWSENELFHSFSHPSLLRFPIQAMSGFYSSGVLYDQSCDPSKYPTLRFTTYLLRTQLRTLFNCNCFKKLYCNVPVACTFLSSLSSDAGFLSKTWNIVGGTGDSRHPGSHPAKVSFETISFWTILWDHSYYPVCLK